MYGESYSGQKLALRLSVYIVAIFKIPVLKVEQLVKIPPTFLARPLYSYVD